MQLTVVIRFSTILTTLGNDIPYGMTQHYMPPDRGDFPACPQLEVKETCHLCQKFSSKRGGAWGLRANPGSAAKWPLKQGWWQCSLLRISLFCYSYITIHLWQRFWNCQLLDYHICLQCLDTVGWAAGRADGLLAWLSVWDEVQICIWSS